MPRAFDLEKEKLRKEKISKTLKRKFKTGERIYNFPMLGKKHSEITLKKMRSSAKERVKKGIALPKHPGFGENHHLWKGGIALYESIHNWVRRNYGIPKKCESCGQNDISKRYEWSNKTGRYLKNKDDWERLCVSCHRKKDGNKPLRPLKIFPNNRRRVGEKYE